MGDDGMVMMEHGSGVIRRQHELQQEIYSLRQRPSSVTEFFTELKTLWEELENYRPMPFCTCTAPCSCAAMRNMRVHKEQDNIIRFLTGLNDDYTSIRSQILIIEPLPTLNRTFSMTLQHERQNGLGVTSNDDAMFSVSATDARRSFGRGKGKLKICTYCGREGHTVDVCYKKHGYPSDNPPVRRKGNNIINLANTATEHNEGYEDAFEEVNPGANTLTDEQYKGLMNLLKQANITRHHVSNQLSVLKHDEIETTINVATTGNNNSDWILDSVKKMLGLVQFNCSVKVVRNDNGQEFNMPEYYEEHGIVHETSYKETPQQNAREERKHQHIFTVARALMTRAGLPSAYWSYVVLHAVYLINRAPSPVLQNESPLKLLTGKHPDLKDLKALSLPLSISVRGSVPSTVNLRSRLRPFHCQPPSLCQRPSSRRPPSLPPFFLHRRPPSLCPVPGLELSPPPSPFRSSLAGRVTGEPTSPADLLSSIEISEIVCGESCGYNNSKNGFYEVNYGIEVARIMPTRNEIMKDCNSVMVNKPIFVDSSRTTKAITKVLKAQWDGPYISWTDAGKVVQDRWFDTFSRDYQWAEGMIDEIRKVFATKTSKIIKSTLWKVRDKGERPRWIPEDHWDGMVQKWGGVPFQQASAQNRDNRAADAAASVYTGGSISTLEHKKRFEQREHREPSLFEVMQMTKKNKAGAWVNQKTMDLAEAYQARRAEKEADLVASTPEGEVPPTLSCSDDNAIYMEAVGGVNKKGRVFGLGGVGTQLAKKGKTPSSSSSSGLPTEVVQVIQNLNDELQEERRQRQLLLERAEAERQKAEEQHAETRRQLAQQQELLMQLMARLPPPTSQAPPPPPQDPPPP
ncbi:hypothetical protein RJT34_08445 [Clitoria ternatea]|uniref:Integrase catalytic domain-containing protein n=1 Tax=Clitoria ternatea TaxID=43366 RepID=A0AAN9PVP4_CLITE